MYNISKITDYEPIRRLIVVFNDTMGEDDVYQAEYGPGGFYFFPTFEKANQFYEDFIK